MPMDDEERYENMFEKFADKGCKLLTTMEELALMPKNIVQKVKYIALCGHEHNVHVNVFFSRGTGLNCPTCVSKVAGDKKRGDLSRAAEGQSLNQSFEDQAVAFLLTILHGFEIKKSFNGCLADLIIRPKDKTDDNWLKVQVKSTLNPPYSFHVNNFYEDCVVVCVCLSDKKMWLFNGNLLKQKKVSIGEFRSKYDTNEIFVHNIQSNFLQCYLTYKLFSFKIADTPPGKNLQKEQYFKNMRIDKCGFLNFDEKSSSSFCYDFIVNNFKVQEKAGFEYLRKDQIDPKLKILFGVHKNNGSNGKKRPYKKGEADFYWLHHPNEKYFYVVPEAEFLVECGDKKMMDLESIRLIWEKFMFNYKELNKEKLISIFESIK